ncbi:hypothetical protein JZ751_002976 [Albula glossodonta]|uniref:Uncharacterized protein n=1 Tax=Albula glossodonta TaxID=121402 RepID=A0A8T2N8F1_9TELE|nr:hypothetical protein JZ751_002976 [Albula glossodonta]
MTPLTYCQTRQEVSLNQQHVHTHSTIERTIGILEGRWMCLDTVGGKLLYKPEKKYRFPFNHDNKRMCVPTHAWDWTTAIKAVPCLDFDHSSVRTLRPQYCMPVTLAISVISLITEATRD